MKAVGTNTLRLAHNGNDFIRRARVALGHNIHIISGQEEARLVFIGVAHSVYNHDGSTLVIDIGGGSTEIIIGKGFQPRAAESLYMGCVNVQSALFPGWEDHRPAYARGRIVCPHGTGNH